MSQQEFAPQQKESSEAAKASQHLYTRSKKSRDMPKNEHPSTFERFLPPYSYPAQDSAATQRKNSEGSGEYTGGQRYRQSWEAPQRGAQEMARRGFSPDGDAFENGYHPERHASGWQVPPWARPQRNSGRGALRLLLGIVLLIVLIKPILLLLSFVVAALAGFALIVVLLPLLIIFFALLIGVALPLTIFFLLVLAGRARWRGPGPRTTWVR